ncbi:hypothetical protein [Spartinivicinus ruber]|uniref:hypothetical protein n=1 Tax=Spartinivicinus ruber TaxID=2683272 RepID=UPI0013D0DAFF|nr:hypothetical protein [Spartinivicinus ruber]
MVSYTDVDNKDLVWDLNHIFNRKKAIDFFKLIADCFCVYSPTVSKLYSNYEVITPNNYNSGLVILPNFYCFHDTFNHIDESAIRPTNIMLVANTVNKTKKLYMVLPIKQQQKIYPLGQGLEVLNSFLKNKGHQFLPVLVNGDLREFRAQSPCLHLNLLMLDKLENLSEFQKQDIAETIHNRVDSLYNLANHVQGHMQTA